jgi:hypothetical protein
MFAALLILALQPEPAGIKLKIETSDGISIVVVQGENVFKPDEVYLTQPLICESFVSVTLKINDADGNESKEVIQIPVKPGKLTTYIIKVKPRPPNERHWL